MTTMQSGSDFPFLAGGGTMGELIRAHDWAATSLGAPETWPQSLRSALSICLQSSFPTAIYWGPELRLLYNDAWTSVPAERHPWALGRPGADVWSDIWNVVGPQFRAVVDTGNGLSTYDQLLQMVRAGQPRETYWNYSLTPIRGEDGSVVGVLNQGNEVTERVLGDRRRAFLLDLSDRLRGMADPARIMAAAQEALGRHLGLSRVGYGEVDATERWFTTESNWTDGSVPSRVGTHDLTAFGAPVWETLKAGEPLIIDDVAEDARTSDPAVLAAFEAIDTRAVLTASLVKNGRMCAAFYVHVREPRPWSAADVDLVAEVAERTWAAAERARAEAALKDSEARLLVLNGTLAQQVADRTADRDRMWRLTTDLMLVARFDTIITASNPAWQGQFGWSESDMVGTSFLDFIHPDDVAPTRAEMGRLAEGLTTFRFENRYRGRDGSYRWLSWTGVPDEKVVHAVARDITAEKQAAIELNLAQEALRQSQKLEAMGQLTGGVAHDFNNLLTPIIGGLDMLQRRGGGDERMQRVLGGALASAERAKLLVQRLLAFARRQPLQPMAVDLKRLVGELAELLGSTIGPRVRLRVAIGPGLPPALADVNQVEMALLNLAVNARDAMPDGGELSIGVELDEVLRGSRADLPAGTYARLTVCDTGLGMDQDTLRRAVEPFFSTKGIGKGTGLGLSMVHGLAAQLGGGMAIESRPGEGTSVHLWLPLAPGVAEQPGWQAGAVTAQDHVGRALLADDEDLVRAATADMLADLGYEVVEVRSAVEAMERIDRGERFDLVVTDHLMNGMTGAELAGVLRVRRPDLPVLIVSGYADVDSIAPDLPRLTKPFRLAELDAAVAGL